MKQLWKDAVFVYGPVGAYWALFALAACTTAFVGLTAFLIYASVYVR